MKNIFYTLASILLISCNNKKNENSDKNIDSIHVNQKAIDSTKKAAKEINELAKKVKFKIQKLEKVDFDGDGIQDYICKSAPNQQGEEKEYWINSNYKIVKTNLLFIDVGIYRQFINLDNDKEPEVFEVNVFEDGANYTILDQNLKTGKDKIIMYYNPVIIEKDRYFWGYPWDITNIISKEENGQTKLYCSLNHKIIRDGNEESDPKHQKQMPVIFFNGKHTQESIIGEEITNPKWLTLQEVINLIEK